VEAITFLMEQNDLTRKDLEPCIGLSGRVSQAPHRALLNLALTRAIPTAFRSVVLSVFETARIFALLAYQSLVFHPWNK